MKLVILARDSILRQGSSSHPQSLDEWNPVPGSTDAIARLSHGGYWVVVITNQSAKQHIPDEINTLNRIHEKMHRLVNEAGGSIEAIFFDSSKTVELTAPDAIADLLLLQEIGERLKVSLTAVPIISSHSEDLQAARELNMTPILVDSDNTKSSPTTSTSSVQLIFSDLAAVADYLLTQAD